MVSAEIATLPSAFFGNFSAGSVEGLPGYFLPLNLSLASWPG
jgi:hypothetical protein